MGVMPTLSPVLVRGLMLNFHGPPPNPNSDSLRSRVVATGSNPNLDSLRSGVVAAGSKCTTLPG
eukprot:1097847-Rhodomonas_salina.1